MERMSERPGIKGTPDGDRIKAKYCTWSQARWPFLL